MNKRARWGVLATAGLAQLMVVLDSTVVTIALPSAQQALGMNDSTRSWVVTAYSLAFGGLLLVGGRLADRLGGRRAFLTGLIGFAFASLLAGVAVTAPMFFAGRALQGVFAALLAPAGLSLISRTFTSTRERSIAFGVYGALTGAGAVVGLLLGGALTEYLDWRWCLLINLPITAIALVGATSIVPSSKGLPVRIDLLSAATSALGMAGVVFALAEGANHGWGSPIVITSIIVGLAGLAAFVLTQRVVDQPLLPLQIVLDRARGGAFLAVGLPQLAMFGFFLVLTYWYQELLAFTPLQTGLAFLPLAVGIGLGSTVISGLLSTRLAPRALIGPSLMVMALGTLWLVGIDPDDSAVYLTRFLPAEVVIGIALGCGLAPAVSTATSGVDDGDAGVASAVVNAVTQLGGSIGTALLNTIAALVAASALSGAEKPDSAARTDATVQGFDAALLVGASLLALTSIVVFVIMPRSADAAAQSVGATDAEGGA